MAFQRRKLNLDADLKQRVESCSKNIFEVFYSLAATPPRVHSLCGQVSGY